MSSSTNKLACTYSLIPRKNAAQITPSWSGPTVSSPVTTMHNLSALNKLWVNSIYESNITSLKSQTSSSINRGKQGLAFEGRLWQCLRGQTVFSSDQATEPLVEGRQFTLLPPSLFNQQREVMLLFAMG